MRNGAGVGCGRLSRLRVAKFEELGGIGRSGEWSPAWDLCRGCISVSQ